MFSPFICLKMTIRHALSSFWWYLRLHHASDRVAMRFCVVALRLPVSLRVDLCCRACPPWRSVNVHTHSQVSCGTGRQLNRSAWGNLGQLAGGGEHAAGDSRTGENSNTSNGHALCFTGRHRDTHAIHKCSWLA